MDTTDRTIWRVRPQANLSAPDYVMEQIRDALLQGQLKPGDRLPSELELAEQCGVSRGSVRQAMKSLETLGILTIRPGDGTYINTSMSERCFNPLAFTLLISNPSIKEMADARYALERDIFELILADDTLAEAIIPELDDNIRIHKTLLAQKVSTKDLVENDLRFHRLLSRGCGNIVLQVVYDYIMDFFRYYLVRTTSRQAERDLTTDAHERIVEALRTRSYSMAKQAAWDTVQIWYRLMVDEDEAKSGSSEKNISFSMDSQR